VRLRFRVVLAAILVTGAIVRLVLAFTTYGQQFDMDSLRIVANALAFHPAHVYDTLRWPYPPGLFPALRGALAISNRTPLPFHGLVQVPMIAADIAIAWVVAWWINGRKAGNERAALIAAALVALGPSFVLISGYHGQIDAIAMLPGLIAVLVWVRGDRRRSSIAGLLVGLGAAVKTVPLFLILALIPTARSRKEAVTTASLAVLVPALTLVPFLALDWAGTKEGLTFNKGVPGLGGPSVLLQPSLPDIILTGRQIGMSSVVLKLADAQNLIVAAAVCLVAIFLFVKRVHALEAASLIWLTVWAVNPNFAYQYVLWGLPFLIAEGRFWFVAALQALLVFPAIQVYALSGHAPLPWLYSPLVLAEWALASVVLLLRLRAINGRAPASQG
jgi:hypothetical protein